MIDLRALLVEREDFEGGMVSKLREGLAQGGPQVRNLREILDVLNKRLAVAAGPQQKKIHLTLGIAEAEGDVARAAKHYERSVELEPRHAGALFRLGFMNDLQGNDHEAIGYYERCLKYPPIGKGVLYNLGVLYEDNEQYDKAAECYRRLNKTDPNDERAKLFVKDAEASLSMYYSPEEEQVSMQFRQVMEIPITDFELSVRSRNCLKRMNIRTLGDLTRITEALQLR